MDRRRKPRVTALLPVRVWGVDVYSLPFIQLARVKNISGGGAVIQGLRRQVKPGKAWKCSPTREGPIIAWSGWAGLAAGVKGKSACSACPQSPTSGMEIWPAARTQLRPEPGRRRAEEAGSRL